MMTIFLRKITGKGQKLQITAESTIHDLIKQIYKVFKYQQPLKNLNFNENSLQRVQIFHKGDRLEEDSQDTLEQAGITSSSILHIVEKPKNKEENDDETLHIRMIIEKKLFQYDIDFNCQIAQLKEVVCEDLGIKDDDLTLSYIGKELDNSKFISQYHFSQNVLLSASVIGNIESIKFLKTYSVSKSYSEESQDIPKIFNRENSSPSPRRKIKKTESMNIEPNALSADAKTKNSNFCSVRLNKIEQKHEQSKNESQINESQVISQQVSSEIEQQVKPIEFTKPKLTLELLSKKWYGDQKVIQTESIVGDEEQEQIYAECSLELIRNDKKRVYVLECGCEDTFENALKVVARLEKTQPAHIKLQLNFDEITKSGISNRSAIGGLTKSPKSSSSLKKLRKSFEGSSLLSPLGNNAKTEEMKTKIVQKAARLKKKFLSIEFQNNEQVMAV